MAIKRCNESFTVWRDGAPHTFTAGQLVDDKHPILRTHGHLFADPSTVARPGGPARVEQATADPGEPRTVTPPAQARKEPEDPEESEGDRFDPGEHTAAQVLAYLKTADDDERARVMAAEEAGQKRKGILGTS